MEDVDPGHMWLLMNGIGFKCVGSIANNRISKRLKLLGGGADSSCTESRTGRQNLNLDSPDREEVGPHRQ